MSLKISKSTAESESHKVTLHGSVDRHPIIVCQEYQPSIIRSMVCRRQADTIRYFVCTAFSAYGEDVRGIDKAKLQAGDSAFAIIGNRNLAPEIAVSAQSRYFCDNSLPVCRYRVDFRICQIFKPCHFIKRVRNTGIYTAFMQTLGIQGIGKDIVGAKKWLRRLDSNQRPIG
jgi:hypothetical protein